MDDVDRKILRELRVNGRVRNQDLARIVGLSPSACLRRVRLLEQQGVILGYTAVLAGAMFDDAQIAIVQVELDRQTEEALNRFETALRRYPEIQEWHLMTGEGDYLLMVRVSGIESYGRFHQEVLSRLPGVSRIRSSFAMRSHLRS